MRVMTSGVRDGDGLAALLRALADVVEAAEPRGESREAQRGRLVARLAAGQRVVRAVQGEMLRATERLVAVCEADPVHGGDAEDAASDAADEVAVALGWHRTTARGYVDDAVVVRRGLPAVAGATEAGAIGRRHVAAIAEHARRLTTPGSPAPAGSAAGPEETCHAAFDRRMAAFAASHTPHRTRREAERLVVALEPAAAADREDRAREARHVSYRPVGDGMGEVVALLPVEDLAAIAEVLDRAVGHAQALAGEARTAGQIRADALCAWAWWALDAGQVTPDCWPLAAGGARPRVRFVATHRTLAGQAEVPGEVVGFGPVSPERVRRFARAVDARRIEVGVDAEGVPLTPVLPVEDGYRPSAALVDAVRVRDRCCRFPGCSQPVWRCDLDHTVPYSRGPTRHRGQTRADNLAAFCRRHHRAKTRGVFRVEQARSRPAGTRGGPVGEYTGELVFTLASGQRIRTRPDPLPADPDPEPPPGAPLDD